MSLKKLEGLKVLGLIPARGGSKGIPNKNLYPINGKPLITYTIEAARSSKLLTQVCVSTDSDAIASVAIEYKAEVPFMRPDELAMDNSGAKEVIEHAIAYYKTQNMEFDFVAYLQPTSPLRIAKDIDTAIEMISISNADSLVTVMDVPHQFGVESLMIEQDGFVKAVIENNQYRRQDKVNYVARNGPAIVITKPTTLKNSNSIYGESVLSYKMPPDRSLDIDRIEDIRYVQWLMLNKNTN